MPIKKREPSKVALRKNAARFRIDLIYTRSDSGNVSVYPHEHEQLPTPEQLFREEYLTKEDSSAELQGATIHVPYLCGADASCCRPVAWLVNGKRMCQQHMLTEMKTNNNPDVRTEERGDNIALKLGEPIPSHLLISPTKDNDEE